MATDQNQSTRHRHAWRIDDFVQVGGTLIAVSQSGFRDADNELRSEPAHKSLGIEHVT